MGLGRVGRQGNTLMIELWESMRLTAMCKSPVKPDRCRAA